MLKGPKIKERPCPDCNGSGFPKVTQPEQPGRKIFPVKCATCGGKGRVADSD